MIFNAIIIIYVSYLESANFDEFWNEVATEVKSHERFKAADAGSTNEHGGNRIPKGKAIVSRGWREGSDLMVIEFDDSRVNPDGD